MKYGKKLIMKNIKYVIFDKDHDQVSIKIYNSIEQLIQAQVISEINHRFLNFRNRVSLYLNASEY